MARADSRSRKAFGIALRILVALLGGYIAVSGLTALMAAALFRAGWSLRVDAVIIATNLSLLAFPAFVIWTFATERPALVGLFMLLLGAAGLIVAEIP